MSAPRKKIGGELVLVFYADGKAELLEDDDPVWFSDADEEFREEFEEEFLDSDDAEKVLEYLADVGLLEESELGDVAVEWDEEDYGALQEGETENS